MLDISRSQQFRLFFLSGFSGLLYQIVWLRLAFAAFGVITPVVSVVLSVFMLGLGVGSWSAGFFLRRRPLSPQAALRAYAAAEFAIGIGSLAVPTFFQWGEQLLLPAGQADSLSYLSSSALIIVCAMAPFCLCMGTTFPFMMQAMQGNRGAADGFSFLYLANVLGALTGTLLTPVCLVEWLGFHGTLIIGLLANWCAAGLAYRISRQGERRASVKSPIARRVAEPATHPAAQFSLPFVLLVLLTSGFASMALEIVWTRAFTPVLRTQVYSFSGLLFAYLFATWLGSMLYRRHLSRQRLCSNSSLLAVLALSATAQILAADPRIRWPLPAVQILWVLLGIVPYCAILGYLTPKLIDEYAAGRPDAVGYAYAVNVLGCVVGPLFASYFLLPALGVQWASLALALPFLLLATWSLLAERRGANPGAPMSRTAWGAWGTAILCGILAATIGTSFEDRLAAGGAKVLRDHTATVIAIDDEGHKDLLVNGMLITAITPSTKLMAHLPLSQLAHEPKSALVICFGMGTTYRSLLSWGIDVTAVELVPSVRDAFGVFFDDAEQVRNNPRGRIIIDDGRRFLRRTDERFDVITLDPPPPVEAAGSSLLYSREFYQLVKPRLTEGGILQQWYPGGDLKTFQALVHSVSLEFPHVRVTRAFDNWGYHILCSMQPIPERTPQQLFERLPDAARRDLVEWTPQNTGEALLNGVISNRYRPVDIVPSDFTPTITDDHPYNEYYLMRRLWELWSTSYTIVL